MRAELRQWTWKMRLAGAAVGAAAWGAFALVHAIVPESVRVIVSFAVFLFGPGAAATWILLREARTLDRWVIPLGAGVAAAPAMAQVLGLIEMEAAFPYLTAALAGGVVAARPPSLPRVPTLRSRSVAACAALCALALTIGATAYAGRLDSGDGGISVFGDYDSFDSTYYAAISGELSGTIPPLAPFHSGHSLNYSYFPHLLIALVHRFAGVPLLHLYFSYAWPLFLLIAALTGFTLTRHIAGTRSAFLAMLLLLVGSDLSFFVPMIVDTDQLRWDPVVWSTNFFSPGAETLLFNTWTPTLAVLFTGCYACARFMSEGSRGWAALACACFGWLVPFKTFAFAALVAGLSMTAIFVTSRIVRTRARLVAAGTLLFAAPYLLEILFGYEDSQAYLTVDWLVIPERIVPRLNLPRFLGPQIESLALPGPAEHALYLAVATAILFLGGLGFRLAGLPALWRAIRHPSTVPPIWTLLGWTAVCGALIPFVIATEPYQGTLHFYQTTLFVMPLFVGRTLAPLFERDRKLFWVITAVVFACAVPSTVHYLERKRSDRDRLLAAIDANGVQIARYLDGVDKNAVLLHRRPEDPSLFAILSGRRTVLAWSRYVRNSAERQSDVNQFFSSAGGEPERALATLRKYGVTHVIETRGLDAIHPAVLERLRLVLQTQTFTLYEVPADSNAPRAQRRRAPDAVILASSSTS